jgi:2-furoate---CoA ligase
VSFGQEVAMDLGSALEVLGAGCAVVGMADERLGNRVVAFVEPAVPALGSEQLDRACLTGGLARFKRPREYVFVKAIPRSASGKLLRRKLRDGDYEPFASRPAAEEITR